MSYEEVIKKASELEETKDWIAAAETYLLAYQQKETIYTLEKIGWCYSRAEIYDLARERFTLLAEKQPNVAKWQYMIGYQYYCQKIWVKAVSFFEKALELLPDYFIVKYRLSYAYLQIAGQFQSLTKPEFWKALGFLDSCHKQWAGYTDEERNKNRSHYADICFLHGKALSMLEKRREEALEKLSLSLEIDPNNEDCQYEEAKTLLSLGKTEDAYEALPKNSKKYYVLELKAKILVQMGKKQQAIKLINTIISFRKKDYLYRKLSELYTEAGEIELALRNAYKSTQMGPENHKNHLQYARILFKTGLLDESLLAANKALKLMKKNYDLEYPECGRLIDEITALKQEGYCDDPKMLSDLKTILYGSKEQALFGSVKTYNTEKGFGFIKSDIGDIFFHISDVVGKEIKVGDKVSFIEVLSQKGTKATWVRIL